MKLVTTEEMRLAEQSAVDAGATWEELMERAGRAVADEVLARLKKTRKVKGRRVLVLVGPGNNGGDALVAARHLRESGLVVAVYLWNRRERGDALLDALGEQGEVAVLRAAEDAGLSSLQRELRQADVVIDGLLGMGLQRPVEGLLWDIVDTVNRASSGTVVAVDLPTGVQADTGQVMGTAIRAAVTVTMCQPKRGLYLFPGAGCAGEVVVADIGIPVGLLDGVRVELMDRQRLRAALPGRPADAHKGTFGRVLVVAGSLHYTGAPHLAAMSAYRVGAGLVTLAPPRSIYPILAGGALESTYLPLPEGEWGAIGEDAVKTLAPELGRFQVLVLGCGLGQHEGTVAFVRRLLHTRERVQAGFGFLAQMKEEQEWSLPLMVLDADALNALAGVPEWWKGLVPGQAVLTPHPGEMARLLGATREEVLVSRVAVAQRAATTWRQVVVFKGAHTVVAHPDGRAVVNAMANPLLASGGTGDVLAGAIGGFMAQGVGLFEAALLGVYIHALAGDILRAELGVAGGLAREVMDRLPQAVERLRAGAER